MILKVLLNPQSIGQQNVLSARTVEAIIDKGRTQTEPFIQIKKKGQVGSYDIVVFIGKGILKKIAAFENHFVYDGPFESKPE